MTISASDVLTMLIPNGGWVCYGDSFGPLVLDENGTPISGVQFHEAAPITQAQFDQGVLDYPAWKSTQDAAFAAIEAQKATDRAAGIAALKAAAPLLTDTQINAMLAPVDGSWKMSSSAARPPKE